MSPVDDLLRWEAMRRWERIKRAAGWTVVCAAFVFAAVLAIAFINNATRAERERQCASLARQTGMEVRYIEVSRWNFDCYVKVGDAWVPRGQVRGTP